ncbi:GNAT family N-acetyltransferase [Streptomyces drozdowiczii]
MITHIASGDLPLLDRAARQFRGVAARATFIESPAVMAFVASEGDEILGWCWGYRLVRPDGSMMLYVHGLDVAEAHRRHGNGRSLDGVRQPAFHGGKSRYAFHHGKRRSDRSRCRACGS